MTLSELKEKIQSYKNQQALFNNLISFFSDAHNFTCINSLYTLICEPYSWYEKKILKDCLNDYLQNYFEKFCTKKETELIDQRLNSLSSTKSEIPSYLEKYVNKLVPVTPEILNRIYYLYQKTGLSQKAFCKYCCLSPNTLPPILSQCLTIPINTLKNISKYTGISLVEILEGTPFTQEDISSYKRLKVPYTKSIKERIFQIRNEFCNSDEQFAKLVHLNKHTMESLFAEPSSEKTKDNIYLATAYAIAEHTDCTIDYVLCKSNDPEKYEDDLSNSITFTNLHNRERDLCLFFNSSSNSELYILCIISFLLLPEFLQYTVQTIIASCARMHPNYRYKLNTYSFPDRIHGYPKIIYDHANSLEYRDKDYKTAAQLYYYLITSLDPDAIYYKRALISLSNILLFFSSAGYHFPDIPKDTQREIVKEYQKLLKI